MSMVMHIRPAGLQKSITAMFSLKKWIDTDPCAPVDVKTIVEKLRGIMSSGIDMNDDTYPIKFTLDEGKDIVVFNCDICGVPEYLVSPADADKAVSPSYRLAMQFKDGHDGHGRLKKWVVDNLSFEMHRRLCLSYASGWRDEELPAMSKWSTSYNVVDYRNPRVSVTPHLVLKCKIRSKALFSLSRFEVFDLAKTVYNTFIASGVNWDDI